MLICLVTPPMMGDELLVTLQVSERQRDYHKLSGDGINLFLNHHNLSMEDEFYITVSTDGTPACAISLTGEFMYVHTQIGLL